MIEIAERLKVLGDQTRLRIFRLLTEESLNVGDLQYNENLSKLDRKYFSISGLFNC